MSFAVRANTEAQLMDYARSFFPLLDIEAYPCPIKIVGADPTLPYSYLPTFDFSHVMTVDYDFIPEATHLPPTGMAGGVRYGHGVSSWPAIS